MAWLVKVWSTHQQHLGAWQKWGISDLLNKNLHFNKNPGDSCAYYSCRRTSSELKEKGQETSLESHQELSSALSTHWGLWNFFWRTMGWQIPAHPIPPPCCTDIPLAGIVNQSGTLPTQPWLISGSLTTQCPGQGPVNGPNVTKMVNCHHCKRPCGTIKDL